MTYYLDPMAALWTLVGLVLGLLIGSLTWRRSARRQARAAANVGNAAAAAAARNNAEHSARELAAVQASMRPLADEVDRLKRELAKAKRSVQEPLPLTAAGAVPASVVAAHGEPVEVVSPVEPAQVVQSVEPVAGTGPIVVADTYMDAASVPNIRQLKGVGANLAAALDAIGLTSVDTLARLSGDEAIDADTRLGVFNGRIAKDRLVEQATLLDEGRTTEYETRFGRIGGPVLI